MPEGTVRCPGPTTRSISLRRASPGWPRTAFPVKLNDVDSGVLRAHRRVRAARGGGSDARPVAPARAILPRPASCLACPSYNARLRTTCVATRLDGGHAETRCRSGRARSSTADPPGRAGGGRACDLAARRGRRGSRRHADRRGAAESAIAACAGGASSYRADHRRDVARRTGYSHDEHRRHRRGRISAGRALPCTACRACSKTSRTSVPTDGMNASGRRGFSKAWSSAYRLVKRLTAG